MTTAPAYVINFSIVGKAGETVSVARLPWDDDGVRRAFRIKAIRATDSSGGNGSIVESVRSGDRWKFSGPYPTELYNGFFEVVRGCTCHPRLPVTATVKFLADCEWQATIIGTLANKDAAVYATTPSVPCSRGIPATYQDVERDDYWYEGLDLRRHGSAKCWDCWFEWDTHATWPWRVREFLVEAEIASKATHEFVVPVELRSVLDRMRVPGYPDGPYDATQAYLNNEFRLRAFECTKRPKPLRYSKDDKGPWACFGVGCIPGAILDPGERLRVCVENMQPVPKMFKAAIVGVEKFK